MVILNILLWLTATLVGGTLIGRLFSWMAAKGWVHDRRTRPTITSMGSSMLELQGLFESGKARQIILVQDSRPTRKPGSGAGPGGSGQDGPTP